jgi:hypothetical protein
VLAPLAGRVATVRVLDYGADKLPAFLHDDGAPGIALLLRHLKGVRTLIWLESGVELALERIAGCSCPSSTARSSRC